MVEARGVNSAASWSRNARGRSVMPSKEAARPATTQRRSGRARFGTVIDGPGAWEGPMDREVVDGLVDAELPLRLGPVALSPGLGVGLGWVHTHEEDSRDAKQTAGLRGELHLALVVPLTQHVAFESTLSLELANTLVTERASRERLPDDPKALAHAGLGLRFEAP